MSGSWWLDVPGAEAAGAARHGGADVAGGLDALARTGADVVVVGAGATGLEAAVLLAEHGADVAVLDAVGVAAGAAGANGGFLLAGLADFHHDAVARHGRAVALNWWQRTAEEIDRVVDEEPTARRLGSLRIAASAAERDDIADHLEAMRRDGLAVEAYDGPEGTGLLVPGDATVDPAARCRRLAARAVAAGARLIAPAEVTAIATGSVVATGRTIAARHVIVCVDGCVELLLPDGLVRERGVRTARLQMLATAPTDQIVLPRPVYRRGGLDYVQQRPSGELLMGGGRDVGGPAEWRGAGAGAARPTRPVQAHLERWLSAVGVRARVTHRWAAWAAFTDDRLPVHVEIAERVTVLGAYSGHGNVIGGMLARALAAQLVR